MRDYQKAILSTVILAVIVWGMLVLSRMRLSIESSESLTEEAEVLSEEQGPDYSKENPGNVNELPNEPPGMFIDTSKDYAAVLKTSTGDIEIDLFEKETPITVNNFVYLAYQNFYNDSIFHRVLKGFMVQGGDPTGTGKGGPPYRFDDELPITRDYNRGIVAMANAGPNTNGSQFFIMHQDYNLPKDYVIFGQVSKGMEVVDNIAEAEVRINDFGEPSRPLEPLTLNQVEIKAN